METSTALKIMNASLIASINTSWKHVLTLLEHFKAESVATILYSTTVTSSLSTDFEEMFEFIKGVSEGRAYVYLNNKGLASAIKKKGWKESLKVFRAAKKPDLSRHAYLELLRL
jgi:wyosine [tRNA(Phe)-imidazoG37] synthetase (radical SAM superfamily)